MDSVAKSVLGTGRSIPGIPGQLGTGRDEVNKAPRAIREGASLPTAFERLHSAVCAVEGQSESLEKRLQTALQAHPSSGETSETPSGNSDLAQAVFNMAHRLEAVYSRLADLERRIDI